MFDSFDIALTKWVPSLPDQLSVLRARRTNLLADFDAMVKLVQGMKDFVGKQLSIVTTNGTQKYVNMVVAVKKNVQNDVEDGREKMATRFKLKQLVTQ